MKCDLTGQLRYKLARAGVMGSSLMAVTVAL